MFSRTVSSVDQIFRMELNGTGVTNVTGTTDNALNGSITNNRQYLVFESNRTGNREIFRSALDGTGVVQLTNDPADDFSPVVSADGTRIAFLSDRSGTGIQLLIMDISGGNVAVVSSADGLQDPVPSPNGSQVAYVAAPNGIPQVFIANANGTNVRDLSGDEAFFDVSPAISPDGTRIAFVRDDSLWIMNSDGTGKTQVLAGSLTDAFEQPSFSPDGTRLIFMRIQGLGAYDIWSVNVNGTSLTNLTNSALDDFKTRGYIGP